MNAKFLILGTIVGGIVLFVWGGLTHAVLPQPISEFKDPQAVVQVIRANTAGNAVYFARQGVFTAVAFRPDFGDKTQNITSSLIIQFCTDCLSALLLCLAVTRLSANSTMGRAGSLLLLGLAAFTIKLLPYWNWYGFSTSFMGMEALDLVGKFFIAGLVLSAMLNKTTKVKAAHA